MMLTTFWTSLLTITTLVASKFVVYDESTPEAFLKTYDYGCEVPGFPEGSNGTCYTLLKSIYWKDEHGQTQMVALDRDTGEKALVLHRRNTPISTARSNATDEQCDNLYKKFKDNTDYCGYLYRGRTGQYTDNDYYIAYELTDKYKGNPKALSGSCHDTDIFRGD